MLNCPQLGIWAPNSAISTGWVLTAGGVKADWDTNFATNQAFNNGAATTVSSLFSCSRASSGYYQNANGTLTQFGNNVLRTGTNGLLVEEARTNIILQSQTLDNASWTKLNVVVTADQAPDPTGGNTTDQVVSTNVADNFLGQTVNSVGNGPGVVWTLSFWAKVSSGTFNLPILIDDGAGHFTINPSTTTVTLTTTLQRFTVTGTAGALTGTNVRSGFGGFATWATANTIFIWGVQLEQGAFATSYIPTTTTSAVRSLDVVSFPTASFNYNSAAQTIYALYNTFVPAGLFSGAVWSFNNVLGTPQVGQDGSSHAYLWTASGTLGLAGGSLTNGVDAKVAAAVQVSNHAISVNSAIATSADAGALASTSSFRAGTGGNGPVNGYIKRLAYWSSRVSNANLQTLTT